jgi:hypothetical protein
MKLAHVLLALSAAALAACSGADIGDDVLGGDDGGGGRQGDGGASAGNTGNGNGPAASGSTASGPSSVASTGPGGTSSVASTGPGGPSSAASTGPGGTSSVSSGSPAVCGDLVCNGAETCLTCPNDCEECSGDCGNGVCDAGESASCPQDCNPQSIASSSSGFGGVCPPDPCEAGGAVDAACTDSCVLIICIQYPECCEGTWSQTCADYALTFGGLGFCTCM